MKKSKLEREHGKDYEISQEGVKETSTFFLHNGGTNSIRKWWTATYILYCKSQKKKKKTEKTNSIQHLKCNIISRKKKAEWYESECTCLLCEEVELLFDVLPPT